ncbi:TetR/AcrR family transcriptional regulator [Odoribacter lunatus]|uniref:TetR/AcrR family transcriptional regulator n=1 Tax=Odoribacter lunatus TaxID=2941335 RepID=UPI00203B6B1B|nr:TetR/AcrR family transcriptional regulator [Odoribacter lunatus]
MNENTHLNEELVSAISELFLTYGLRSTSMDDIATHLKMSKKTLYQFFENKDDVVEQVVTYRIEKGREKHTSDELLKMTPIQFLYNIKTHILESLNTQLPANYFDIKKYHPDVHQRVLAEESTFMETLMDTVLQRGVAEGFLREDTDMKLQVYLLTRQFCFFREQEFENSGEYPIGDVMSMIIENFILALVTEKGRQEFERIKKEMINK